ncbi:MAG: NAD-dependent epimerase/dehydratase family protein [Rhodothermales bacterium]
MISVVSGTNGFIGSRLVEALLSQGHEVRALTRSPNAPAPAGTTPFPVDFARPDRILASGALEGADYVFHVAGVTRALTIDAFREGNVTPLRSLMSALETAEAPLRRLTLVSSQAAAGPARGPGLPVDETMPPSPFEIYGQSKYEAERLLQDQTGRLPYTIIRPSAVYGPRDQDFLVLFKQLRRGAGLYPANKSSRIATIHVDDLIQGMLRATFEDAGRDEVFFLTHEEDVGWREVYAGMARAMDRPLRFELEIPRLFVRAAGAFGDLASRVSGRLSLVNSHKVSLGLSPYWTCSAEKARRLVRFTPSVPLNEGLAATYRWYREHGWL